MKFYHHDHHGEHDHCCHEHHHDHDHEGCCHEHEHDHDHCCHEHEHHHDEPVRDPASLGDLEKARILLSHMLDHNQHHEEEMAALAKRFNGLRHEPLPPVRPPHPVPNDELRGLIHVQALHGGMQADGT